MRRICFPAEWRTRKKVHQQSAAHRSPWLQRDVRPQLIIRQSGPCWQDNYMVDPTTMFSVVPIAKEYIIGSPC